MADGIFLMPNPDCYIYLHHVKNKSGKNGVFILLPSYADAVNDSINVSFQSSTPLSRSAPIYSYENSGPRSLQVHFDLHRDMMFQLNWQNSNANVDSNLKTILDNYTVENAVENSTFGNYVDYVDIMAKEILAAALPSYNASNKMVNPPLVSLKLGNDIFITGVISGQVGVTYGLPILRTNKYAHVQIDFGINEVIPYSADEVVQKGSFRGMDVADLFTRTKYVYGSSGQDALGAYGTGNAGHTSGGGTFNRGSGVDLDRMANIH